LKVILSFIDQVETFAPSKLLDVLPELRLIAELGDAKFREIGLPKDWIIGGGICSILDAGVSIKDSIIEDNFTATAVTEINPIFYGHAGALFSRRTLIQNSTIKNNTAINGPDDILTIGGMSIESGEIGDIDNT
jgi:hypothetical protein